MSRLPTTLPEVVLETFAALGIERLYHGTTRAAWAKDGIGALYLTSSLQDAWNYASDAGEAEWDDEVHDEDNQPDLIVVSWTSSQIAELLRADGIRIEPDWGWADGLRADAKHAGGVGHKPPSWSESLRKVGSFAITGFASPNKLGVQVFDEQPDPPVLAFRP